MPDTVYSTDIVIIDYDFTNTSRYSDISGDTFTFDGKPYKIGVNAFKTASAYDDKQTLAAAIAALQAGDPEKELNSTIIFAAEKMHAGNDYPVPAWKGTLTFDTIGTSEVQERFLHFNGDIVIAAGAKFAFTAFLNDGKTTVQDGANIKYIGALGSGYNGFNDLVLIADNDPETPLPKIGFDGADGFQFNGHVTIVGDPNCPDEVMLNCASYDYINEGATFDISNGAKVTFSTLFMEGAAGEDNGAVINIDGSTVNFSAGLNLNEHSTINLDMDSKLNILYTNPETNATKNLGTIILDATGFDGNYRKPINLYGFSGNPVIVQNVAEGETVVVTEEGDVFLTKADMTHLFVNPEWKTAGYAEGEEIPGESGLIYAANALANFADAYSNKTPGVTEDITVLNGESDILAKTYTGLKNVTLENGATLKNAGVIIWGDETNAPDESMALIVKAGGKLAAKASANSLNMAAATQLSLNGIANDAKAMLDYRYDSTNEANRASLFIASKATLDATFADIYVDTLKLTGKAAATLTNATLDADNGIIIGATNDDALTSLSADNSDIRVRDVNDTNKSLFNGDISLKDSTLFAKASTTNLALENNADISLDNSTWNLAKYSGANYYNFSSNGKITLANASHLQLLDGSSLVNAGTVSLDASSDLTIADAGNATNSGTMALAAGAAVTVGGTLTNSGNISFAWNSASTPLTAGDFNGATGALTINIDSLKGQYAKLIDLTATGATLANFGTVNLSSQDYAAAVMDDDLYALSLKNIIVDYNPDAVLPVGYAWGINAFHNLDAASAAPTSRGTRTYELIYKADALMTLNITAQAGSSNVKIYDKTTRREMASLSVVTSTQTELEIAKDQHIMVAFSGNNADYAFSASFLEAHPQVSPDLDIVGADSDIWVPGTLSTGQEGYIYQDSGAYVGYKTDAKVYAFEVGSDMSASFNFGISGAAKRITFSLINQDGKTIFGGTTESAAAWSKDLTSGSYRLVVDSYDNKTGDYCTNFNVTIEADVNKDVALLDDNLTDNPIYYKSLSTASPTAGFVGLGDKKDLIALKLNNISGSYSFSIDAEEGNDAQGLTLELLRKDGTANPTLTSLAKAVYRLDEFTGNMAATITDYVLDASKDYYLRIASPSKESSFRNATYSVTMTLNGEHNPGISADDDSMDTAKAVSLNNMTEAAPYSEWLGTVDPTDWIQLAEDASFTKGNYTFTANAVGGLAIATIWQTRTVAGVTTQKKMGTFYGRSDGITTTNDTLTLSLDPETYDYYIEVHTMNVPNSSVEYNLSARKNASPEYISKDDDARISAAEANIATLYENWVGSEDTTDWVKLTGWTPDNSYKLTVSAEGGQVTADIRQARTVAGSTEETRIERLLVNDGETLISAPVTFAAGTDYYIRFNSQYAPNVSAGYTLSIAPA